MPRLSMICKKGSIPISKNVSQQNKLEARLIAQRIKGLIKQTA